MWSWYTAGTHERYPVQNQEETWTPPIDKWEAYTRSSKPKMLLLTSLPELLSKWINLNKVNNNSQKLGKPKKLIHVGKQENCSLFKDFIHFKKV